METKGNNSASQQKVLRFDPPLRHDGNSYGELTFDFDRLNDTDFARARLTFEKLFKPRRNPMLPYIAGDSYLRVIIGQSARDVQGNAIPRPVALIKRLPNRHYGPLAAALIEARGKEIDAFVSNVQRR